jgi:hypothetical protein
VTSRTPAAGTVRKEWRVRRKMTQMDPGPRDAASQQQPSVSGDRSGRCEVRNRSCSAPGVAALAGTVTLCDNPVDDASEAEIHASDIYEWVAGGFFVVQTAHGCIGARVGAIEMIGYDPAANQFRTHFFDS